MSGVILNCHNWPLLSSVKRPGMLKSTLQCIGQPPPPKKESCAFNLTMYC